MGSIERTETYRVAYILDERMLREVVEVFQGAEAAAENVPSHAEAVVRFSVQMEKESLRSVDLDEVLALTNVGRQEIRTLTISSSSYAKPQMYLSFSSGGRLSSVHSTVRGSADDATVGADRLEHIVERLRQWYTRLAFADALGFMMALLTVLWGGLFLWALVVYLINPSSIDSSNEGSSLAGSFLVVAIIGVSATIGVSVNAVRRWLFPTALFALGDQHQVDRKYEKRRQLVGSGIVLSFAVSVIAGLAQAAVV